MGCPGILRGVPGCQQLCRYATMQSDGDVALDEPSLSAAEEVVAVNVSWLTAASANHFGIGGEEGLAEVELRQCRVLGRDEPQS